MDAVGTLNKLTNGLENLTNSLEQQNKGSRSCFLSFFTVMLILTLDASNGKDLLDVIVPYIESVTK